MGDHVYIYIYVCVCLGFRWSNGAIPSNFILELFYTHLNQGGSVESAGYTVGGTRDVNWSLTQTTSGPFLF